MHNDEEAVEDDADENGASAPTVFVSKSVLLRDVIVFQVKLFIDGLRDLILVPVSLVAALLSLMKSGHAAGSEFYEVVSFGRKTERSINLFEAAERLHRSDDDTPIPDLDDLVGDIEDYLRSQVEDGKLDAVKAHLQGLSESLNDRKAAHEGGGPPPSPASK